MTAYFTASIAGKKQYLSNYLKILDYLKKRGVKVICDHIINTTEAQVYSEKREDRLKFLTQVEKWIKTCDLMIVEASYPSISVGYEIATAILYGKFVLILYSEGGAPSLLAHPRDEKVICEKYSSEVLEDLIDDFLAYAQGSVDTRFTFYLTHDQVGFLEKVSLNKKIPKSVYLRRLIDLDMKRK